MHFGPEAFYAPTPRRGKLKRVSAASVHIPVLLEAVIELLRPAPGMVFVDGTLGGGGHARRVAQRIEPGGRIIAVDLDPDAIARAETTLAGLPIAVAVASYAEIPDVLAELGIDAVDGVLLDLGLSSDQLADAARGFSFQSGGELDLRFDPRRGEPAWRLLERIGQEDLGDLIFRFGEERFSRRIARRIVETRRTAPIRTAAELAALVRSCVPRTRGHGIDPATRTFQALRIAVNDELATLESALARLPDCLKPGGRLAVISFHSLEDRIVKHAFRSDERLAVVTRRPLTASDHDVARNVRALQRQAARGGARWSRRRSEGVMDDDALNRPEAVAGLSFLGLLMVALVGVIVYRIVAAKPAPSRPIGSTVVSSDAISPVDAGGGAGNQPRTAPPIPIAADQAADPVPLTSGAEPAPSAPSPVEPAAVDRPHFVAPGNRGRQP